MFVVGRGVVSSGTAREKQFCLKGFVIVHTSAIWLE